VKGSGTWHAEQAWIGHPAQHVVIEVDDGRIKSISTNEPAPAGAVPLRGWTLPGFANAHSHAFQAVLRGRVESGAGDFWAWRAEMYRAAESLDEADYIKRAMLVFRTMLEAGITTVGEFHYLHRYGNGMGESLIGAARETGIRITLIDACYLRGGMDDRPLDPVQQTFSDGDVERWTRRMDDLEDADGVRIGAAIHSVRAVDPASMRTIGAYARTRGMPLHIHLAEQPAEVEECLAVEGCTPTELLEREGILNPELTAIHAIHVDDDDIALLGRHEVGICACTTTERDLGDRVGPHRALTSAGCALSLGSDSNAVIDILEEARGAELDQRRATGRRVLHQPDELFRAATVGGMRALGWDGGELKPGMLADFVTIDRSTRPIDLAELVFAASARDVTNVVVGGTTVVSR
jgi:formiminoglutamate deiminase